jgi:hypothetical protein
MNADEERKKDEDLSEPATAGINEILADPTSPPEMRECALMGQKMKEAKKKAAQKQAQVSQAKSDAAAT